MQQNWSQRRGDGLVYNIQGSSSGAAIYPLARLQIAIGNKRAMRQNSSHATPQKRTVIAPLANMGKTAQMGLKKMHDVSTWHFFPQDSPPPCLQTIDGVIAFAGIDQSQRSSYN